MTATKTREAVYTVEEVATDLKCSPETIYRMIRRSELRVIRLGRVVRIPESAINELLEGGAESA